jgi:6-phosphogluconate dehydrogenase
MVALYDRARTKKDLMSETSTKVGCIGLGRMGTPMAINILNAGFTLTVYDLRAEAMGRLLPGTSLAERVMPQIMGLEDS